MLSSGSASVPFYPPVFVESTIKSNSTSYVNLLQNHFLPLLLTYPEIYDFGCWQEDDSASHTDKRTEDWKEKEWPFSELSWPPSNGRPK